MSTIRGYVGTNLSADTGEVVVLAKPVNPAFLQGQREDVVTLRMRVKVNTPQSPFLGGTMLARVRWDDGNAVQNWDIGLQTDVGNYAENGMDIWMDSSRDLTIQVLPVIAGGSVDVALDYVEL